MDSDLQKMLMTKAGALLARRAYSRGELRSKLIRMAGPSQVEPALDRLEQLNLLNDADYAYNFALRRIRQEGWGPAKVQESLLRRQVSQAVIDGALDRVRNEMGGGSLLAGYIKKYRDKYGMPADPKGIRKFILRLSRRGFDEGEIFRALKQQIPEAILQRFETGE